MFRILWNTKPQYRTRSCHSMANPERQTGRQRSLRGLQRWLIWFWGESIAVWGERKLYIAQCSPASLKDSALYLFKIDNLMALEIIAFGVSLSVFAAHGLCNQIRKLQWGFYNSSWFIAAYARNLVFCHEHDMSSKTQIVAYTHAIVNKTVMSTKAKAYS